VVVALAASAHLVGILDSRGKQVVVASAHWAHRDSLVAAVVVVVELAYWMDTDMFVG
jgi:hypothetical protein